VPEELKIPLNPSLPNGSQARRVLVDTVKELAAISDLKEVLHVRTEGLRTTERVQWHRQLLRVCISVFCDLRVQGWTFFVEAQQIWGTLPQSYPESPLVEKQRIREAHLFERDCQLRTPAVREFVRGMERQHIGPNGWVSIFSLMRDGQELAGQLRAASRRTRQIVQAESLRNCIDPYIQFVEPNAVCSFTGFKLTDIWRYFRHTWVTPYYSIPGRQLWILIRDRAASGHPVIGIAALGSAVVQLTPRDSWIGWTPEVFLEQLQKHPTTAWARWIDSSLRDLIRGIYVKDFDKERIFNRADLRTPSAPLIRKLLRVADQARLRHVKYPKARQHKKTEQNWEVQAKTYLFRGKRARVLAKLLGARQELLKSGFNAPTATALKSALKTASGRHAIQVVLNQMKAIHIGIDMLDITVCGAIPPYNALLGGKLVAMLMASPDIALFYERKYGCSPSIIASSMAGKPVVRKPRLVLLGTTSLYGVSSSQYNRIRIPAAEAGGQIHASLSYELLGRSLGYGSYHLSATTVTEIEVLLAQSQNGRRVNSIFGEGVNPRIRKIRDGLTEAGFPSDVLLMHGNPRLIYGIRLASNFREILLGRSRRPRNLLPRLAPLAVTNAIADYWAKRWLSKRMEKEDVLHDVALHVLSHPLEHGARVSMPPVEEELSLVAAAR
jgi:hypothetical protein